MSRVWFTSDLHFGHAAIIRYCSRPYKDVEEMDNALITNWNACVAPEDTVYVLGDVFMCNASRAVEVLTQLTGKKVLVYGNHDKVIRKNYHIQKLFSETHAGLERSFQVGSDNMLIVMNHYAMRVWNQSHRGSWMLYGHSHGTLPPEGKQLDVGVDNSPNGEYRPWSLEEVASFMANRKIANGFTD